MSLGHARPTDLIDGDVCGNCARIILSLWDCLRIVSVGGKCLCSFQIHALSNVKSVMERGDTVLSVITSRDFFKLGWVCLQRLALNVVLKYMA